MTEDHHYCPFCGASDAFCGCPDDPNTSDRMKCPHCGGLWSRDYGDTSTTCLHRSCRKDGSVVEQPAKYPPSLPDSQLEILEGAAANQLWYSGDDTWTLHDSAVTSNAKLLVRFGFIKLGDSGVGRIWGALTPHGQRLLDHVRTPQTDHAAYDDNEPFEPDENDPNGGWTL